MDALIYQITLPEHIKPADFEKFMLGEVFPGIDKGPTRVGLIRGMHLYRGNVVGHADEYLWVISGDDLVGLPGERAIRAKLHAFGVRMVTLRAGRYVEVGAWSGEGKR